MHIERIRVYEKLSKELGGSGWLPPTEPATTQELVDDAIEAVEKFPDLNMTVWKVLYDSVNWKRYAATRRLLINHRAIPCTVLGSTQHWWFVSVDARYVIERLS